MTVAAYETASKKSSTAYLLWLFFGMFGVHNFYLNRSGAGIAQALLTMSIIGTLVSLPWVLIDVFLIGSSVENYNRDLWARMHYAASN